MNALQKIASSPPVTVGDFEKLLGHPSVCRVPPDGFLVGGVSALQDYGFGGVSRFFYSGVCISDAIEPSSSQLPFAYLEWRRPRTDLDLFSEQAVSDGLEPFSSALLSACRFPWGDTSVTEALLWIRDSGNFESWLSWCIDNGVAQSELDAWLTKFI